MQPIEPQELVRIRDRFPRRKFFVSGYPRSGTTLLARLLRAHPVVDCRWQAHIASDEPDLLAALSNQPLHEWLDRPSNRWVGQAALTPAIVRLAADFILERELEPSVGWVGDKTPVNDLQTMVGRLSLIYPDAHLILIVRDGRDAVLSQRIQAFLDQAATLSIWDLRRRRRFMAEPEAYGAAGRSLFAPAWLARAGRAWNRAVTDGVDAAQTAFAGGCTVVRFEDLIEAPAEHIRQLWQELGVGAAPQTVFQSIAAEMESNPAADWHAEIAPRVAARFGRGRQGGWREWFTSGDLRQFEDVARGGMNRWGYD